jgi:ketosteroid isomerase-like protein
MRITMVDIETEKRLVDEVVQGLVEADISKDLNRVMAFFAEDIIYQPPGVPPLFGKDAVRQYLDGAFDLLEDMKAGSDRTEVSASGDLAYSVGWFKNKRYSWDDYMDMKYFFALRKTVDGWKIVAESFSRNDREGGEYVGYHPREER